ncbi:hypothetical protein PCANB_000540 [Pneumocystis canis]|nr:hypothetical protein PCANB_000540 [Pneumocystis canis]
MIRIFLKETNKKLNEFPLEVLNYPIGMKEPPISQKNIKKKVKTWKEKIDNMFSLERNIERRKELLKDISKSYWSDFQAMKYHQGKTWIAPKYLFRKDKALYIANFHGITLSNEIADTTSLIKLSPVSLISIFSSNSGEKHIRSFLSHELHSTVSDIQFIYINLQENFLKAGLVRMFSAAIRNQILKEQHSKYFFVNKLPRNVKENMMISNMCVGYVYLVDNQCRIRWAGCGNATNEEKEYLITCSQRLIKEYDKQDINV